MTQIHSFAVLTTIAAVATAATVVAAVTHATGFDDPPARHRQTHAEAVAHLQSQRYASAYGRFADLADQGHGASALMALSMLRHGSTVYGSEWSATPGQLQRWTTIAMLDLRKAGVRIADHDRGE